MSYSVKKLDGLPVVVTSFYEDTDLKSEVAAVIAEEQALLDRLDQKVYLITDFGSSQLDLDDIMIAANTLSHGQIQIAKHPKLQELIFITQNATVALATQGLQSDAFGNIKVKLFTSMDEALAYVQG